MPSNEKDRIDTIISQALAEDLHTEGDITSQSIFDKDHQAEAVIKSKEPGILSGVYLIEPVYSAIDSTLLISPLMEDGASLENGTELCRIQGSIRSILAGERTVLNFLQRLSGIATRTHHLVSLIPDNRVKLLDTRKTTPGLRPLEKRAVLAGGGCNHRFGLYDMILIKDTHVKAAGSPAAAIRKAREYPNRHPEIKIEVEVQSLTECADAITESPDRIMLDNMSIEDMTHCVKRIRRSGLPIEIEASGNVTEENIRPIAETGVDYISSGSLTHSVKALDIHLILL